MKLNIKIFILLTFITSATAYGCGGEYVVRSAEKADGTNVAIVVHESDFDGIPVWTPGENDPPLPLKTAREIALTWAQSEYLRYDRVEISTDSSLSMVGPIHCTSSEDNWLYIFDVVLVIDGNLVSGVGNWVAVFMDGTTVGPIEMES